MSYQNSPYPQQPYVPPPNSTMAIVSLVSGILGLTFVPILGSIVALITGFMARNEIKQSNGQVGGGGMATAGLILGGIGMLVLCCGIIFFLLTFLGVFGAIWSSSSSSSSILLPALLS